MKQVNYNPMNVRIKSEHESIIKRSKKNKNKEFIFFNPATIEASSQSGSSLSDDSSLEVTESDTSSEKSDKSSGSADSQDEDEEEKLYQQLLKQQFEKKDKLVEKDSVINLVDNELIELLKAFSLFKVPNMGELKQKMVRFGPMVRQKLLILDMDETMLHTKFFTNNSGMAPTGL